MPSSRPRVDSYPWVGGLADTENYNSPSKRRLPRIAALASSLPFYGFTLSSRSARTGAGRGRTNHVCNEAIDHGYATPPDVPHSGTGGNRAGPSVRQGPLLWRRRGAG